jgi:GNAT superfamily N-acetyltransferase
VTRRAEPADLGSLMELYLRLNPDTPRLSDDKAREIWADTLSRPGIPVFVSVIGSQVVATCVLITAPNLMRGGRPHALIENVVTHRDFRRQGIGKAVILAALDAAWSDNCRNVMLLTGRKDPAVHRFYERCGFEAGIKTGYVVGKQP